MRFIWFILPAIACATFDLDPEVERARKFEREFLRNRKQFSDEWYKDLCDRMAAAQEEVKMNAREVAEAKRIVAEAEAKLVTAEAETNRIAAEAARAHMNLKDVVDPGRGITGKPAPVGNAPWTSWNTIGAMYDADAAALGGATAGYYDIVKALEEEKQKIVGSPRKKIETWKLK